MLKKIILFTILIGGVVGLFFLDPKGEELGQSASLWFPSTGDDPEYVLNMDDGCAEWSSNILTSSGAGCGSGSVSFSDLNGVATSSDATGDVYYLNSSGQITNLGIGSAGQVLKVSAGIPSWGADNGTFAWTPTSYGNSTTTTIGLLDGFVANGAGSSTISHTLHADGTIDFQNLFVLDAAEENGIQRLRIQGSGVNDAAELFLQAKGSANSSRVTVTPDSSNTNFSFVTLESNGTSQIIKSGARGNETVLPLDIVIEGNATSTFDTSGLFSTHHASTTRFSNFDTAYFGGTATTSIDSSGNTTFGGNIIIGGDTINEFAGTGLTVTGNALGVDTSQNISTLSNLTSNGFVKTSGGTGALSIDTNTYLTGNETITLSGDISGSGATSITTTIGSDKILESMLKAVNTAVDEDILTYESTTGDFEWHTPSELSLQTQGDVLDDFNTLGAVASDGQFIVGTGAGVFAYESGATARTSLGAEATLVNEAGLYAALSDVTQFWEAGDALSSGSITSGFGNIDIGASNFDADGTITSTGTVNFGGASLEIPNGTNPTTDSVAEMAFDTTDNQLIVDDGTNDLVFRGEDRLYSFTVASTSPEFVSGGVIPLPPEKDGYEMTQFACYVDGGTSVVVKVSDGTNDTETITCATTLTQDTDVATNDTATAGELMEIQIGTITGTPDYLSFSIYGIYTRE